MNLFQRFIYFKEIKNFFKFDYKKSNKIGCTKDTFREISTTLLELYENILKINENFEFSCQICSQIFPIFNRIFKYMIKYKLLGKEQISKYFELVLDTLALGNEHDNSKEN